MPIGDPITPEMLQKNRAAGFWPSVSNVDLLDRAAALYPDKEALVDSRSRLTYRQFADASKRLALAFHESGLKKGDVLVAQLPNCVEFMLILYGLRRIGVIPLFLTMDLRGHEIRHALERSDAVAVALLSGTPRFDFPSLYRDEILPRAPLVTRVYVVGDEAPAGMLSIRQMLADPIETRYAPDLLATLRPELEHPWNMTSTSGTTAMPKFALLKENSAHGRMISDRTHATPDDVVLVVAPLRGGGANIYKYVFPVTPLKGVFQEHFDAEESLRLVERERATIIAAVPAQLIKMLDCPRFDSYDLSSLRLAYYAGAALPIDAAERLRQRMGLEVLGEYGSMDAGTIFTVASLDDPQEVRYRTVGRPVPGVVVRVVDENGAALPQGEVGELQFGGPCIGRTGGYFKAPELTALAYTADGYFQTGDLGMVHPDGNVSVVGRKKDMIIRGGQNISPKEIEELICAHPKVLDVAVVGMPDRVMGEKACAFVIPKADQTVGFEELIAFLRQQEIAAYKLPERLELLAEFPMSAGGQKVQKNILREWVTKKLQEEGK